MSLKISPNSTLPPVGNEPALITRNIVRKNTYTILNAALAASVVYTSPWQDTQGSGDTVCSLSIFNTTAITYTIQGCDDPAVFAASSSTFTIDTASTSTATSVRCSFLIPTRYWRITFTNAASVNVMNIIATVSNAGILFGPNSSTYLPVTIGSGNTGDGVTTVGLQTNAGSLVPLEVANGFITSATASGSNYSCARTPAIFTGGQGAGGSAFLVWNPATTKKPRAMRYAIDIAEDATITSGPLPINIGFRFGLPNSLAAAFSGPRTAMFDYSHRVVLPAAVLATGFDGYVSPWVDLGNGVIAPVSGQPLYCGVQAVQPTSGVTPTWTLATTGQWEAGCAAFTTTGGRGAFKLRQYLTAAGVASAITTAQTFGRGSAVFVLVRTTNIAGGVPTVTVSDTATNTWTKLTAINNASDTGPTNGSSLQLIYCLNMAGTDANLGADIITAQTSVNNATITQIIVAEYSSIVAADATAQTTGTGNSTAPAAAAYSPTSTGTLVLTYAATGTNQATCPTLGTAGFFALAELGLSNAACLLLGDNWGNGTLAAGLVNVAVVGTEE
jgi:hypothetical protein